MSADEETPQSDCTDGAVHPRMTDVLLGQSQAETNFLEAFNSDRLHHGWLISGPKGIGKATLAWKIARFLITQPMDQGGGLFDDSAVAPSSLDAPSDHPALARIQALAEPSLLLLRIAWDEEKKKFKQAITVDEVRKLKGFFQMSSADGGRRVVIIDAADDLNTSAANALLKVLEEPPAHTVMLLISHQPSRLLPTIRSRCRELRCLPLGQSNLQSALEQQGYANALDTAMSELSSGSVSQALRLTQTGGAELYLSLCNLLKECPRFDRSVASAIAEKAASRTAPHQFDLTVDLVDLLLSRLARSAIIGEAQRPVDRAEAELFAALAPDAGTATKWAGVQQELGQRARAGRAVNLDPSSLILDMLLKINEHAATAFSRL